MDPRDPWQSNTENTAPRARGDGPWPHPLPSRMIGCSPRTRGWTYVVIASHFCAMLLPAHAGMDPPSAPPPATSATAPRARGDGPTRPVAEQHRKYCSPRTRGWTLAPSVAQPDDRLLPAHAGMDLRRDRQPLLRHAAPRARGDGPRSRSHASKRSVCSPRTRGWTYVVIASHFCAMLLPAHAGMDPGRGRTLRRGRSAPRARGDGPQYTGVTVCWCNCSPRTRG